MMATSIASDNPVAASAAGDGFDPFVASPPGPTHLRHSTFDTQLFGLAPGSSADQVKRAIEAHLRDTERRMEEAGKLGTALVQQQKQLTEKLREVEQLQSEAELNPELRQRLIEIEKDYNEVARDSARALLPKQRVPSNESQGPHSPFSPDGKVARRSVSPSKFETLAAPSPTKFGVPNRKLRNQPTSRIHDIEFAAEISTSLIAQVRNLQALLNEREEELKEVKSDRSRLEIEAEGFQQRVQALDESENRYKDENWNLETQIHELIAAQKDAADREKKLTQTLNIVQAERNATQRELEEVKDSLARQDEKHSAEIKNLEIELGTSRRTAAVFETERSGLQKKVEELTGQNQELARAFSALQRGRTLERDGSLGVNEENFHPVPDHNTPEHSPPPSPMKPTPRHSALESETLKTSLGHAQRTIQTLRTNIHREKTEKLELKRMLQDARDEVEKLRNDPHALPKKSRKAEARELKKPIFKLNQLGVARSSRTEVVEDPEWEDQSEAPSPRALSPRVPSHRTSTLGIAGALASAHESSSEHFETANETSDAAFETAHERATETEDFQTGVEDMSDDSTATETEASRSRGVNSIKRPPALPPHQSSNHYSFDSTASTSSEDDDYPFSSEMKTPTAGPRMRMRMSRGSLGRRSRHFSEEPVPASVPANNAPLTPGGQSLYAELGELDNSDEDSSCAGTATPSRRSIRSATPATPGSVTRQLSPPPELPSLPKIMVDSGMMTEPVDIRPMFAVADTHGEGEDLVSSPRSDVSLERPMSSHSVIGPRRSFASMRWLGEEIKEGESSRPLSYMSYSDASVQHDWDMDAKLAQFPSPPTAAPPPTLSMSSIQAEFIEPQAEPEIPAPPLSVSFILSEQTEPVTEQVELPALSMPSLISEHVEPLAEPVPEPPALSAPSILAQDIEPLAPTPITLSLSTVQTEQVEPVAEPEPAPPALSLSTVKAEQVEPVVEPEPAPPTLSLSTVKTEQVEPVAEPELPPPTLSLSTVKAEEVEPVAEPEPAPPSPIILSLSTVQVEQVEPVAEPEPAPPSPIALSFSTVKTEQVEPVAEPEPAPPSPIALSFPTIRCEHVEPIELPAPIVEKSLAPVVVENLTPKAETPLHVPLTFSSVVSEHVEPQTEAPLSPVEPQTEAPLSPVELSFSTVKAEEVEPRQEPETPAPSLAFAPIQTLDLSPREVSLPPLALSSVQSWGVEPVEVLETPAPSLAFTPIQALDVSPCEPSAPPLAITPIQALDVSPCEPSAPPLAITPIQALDVSPCEPSAPPLAITPIQALDVSPREPVAPALAFTPITALDVSPREPAAPALAITSITALDVSPREPAASPLALSSVRAWEVEPVEVPVVPAPALSLSTIEAQNIEPIRVEEPEIVPVLGLSGIKSLHTEPAEPRSPWRNAFIIPRDTDVGDSPSQPQTPKVAEGLDSQVLSSEPEAKQIPTTTDQGAQTALTSEAIDQMLRDKTQPLEMPSLEESDSFDNMTTPSTVRIHRPRQNTFEASARSKGKLSDHIADVFDPPTLRRPGSSTSVRSSVEDDVPPLPSNHREVIEAARTGSSQGGQGSISSMGPPLFPASSLKPQSQSLRPRTPNSMRRPISPISVMSGRGTPTPRAPPRSGYGTAEIQSLSKTISRSRKSSVSSFTSEVDTRFNMHQDNGYDPHGLGPNTDPRMIQAITQTMIGEYLWKYTRKTGRGEMSENRHRRYFWVHPYTRTLYWSDRDPSAAGRSELRAKSVQIEVVRVVADDNPMPPGLHRKSLIIVSPGRSIKFTCTTGQRHETWFNALSYLLLRTANEGQSDAEEIAGNITREDVDEFNPQYAKRPNGSRAPPSLSSYNSRSVRDSPVMMDAASMSIPTLTPSRSKASQGRPQYGTLSRISGYFGSIRSRSVPGRDSVQGIFETPDALDSAEDVRQMIERQDREADRLENVRACCDGKHDVGTLTNSAKRAHHHHSLAGTRSPTPGPSSTPTPVGTIRSRA